LVQSAMARATTAGKSAWLIPSPATKPKVPTVDCLRSYGLCLFALNDNSQPFTRKVANLAAR